jgi:hypothetical protein
MPFASVPAQPSHIGPGHQVRSRCFRWPTDVSEIHAQLCRRFLGATSTSMSVLTEEDAIALALHGVSDRAASHAAAGWRMADGP